MKNRIIKTIGTIVFCLLVASPVIAVSIGGAGVGTGEKFRQVEAILLSTVTDTFGIKSKIVLSADQDGIIGMLSNVTGFASGGASDNSSYGVVSVLAGDGDDTDHNYISFDARYEANGGTSDSTGLKIGSNFTNALDLGSGRIVLSTESDASVAAGDTLSATSSILRVAGDGGAVTLTSTPTIADAVTGVCVRIMGTNDTNTVTLQDESNLGSSGLQLSGGVDFTLGEGDFWEGCYDSSGDFWAEVTRSDN